MLLLFLFIGQEVLQTLKTIGPFLFCLLCKLFDLVVSAKVCPLFKTIIIPEQHGFFSKRSTVTNLFSYINLILEALGAGCFAYTDFGKAFDKVNHSILLQKLSAYGISESMLLWFASYLADNQDHNRLNWDAIFRIGRV